LTRPSRVSTLYTSDPAHLHPDLAHLHSTLCIWLPATPAPHHTPVQTGPDYLRRQAESLISTLSDEDALAHATKSAVELIVDGYAHVLALEVDRMRMEREIARLAASGDPQVAGELQELSVVLRCLTRTSERLRDLLDSVRARIELGA
jgi:hypothetical protein